MKKTPIAISTTEAAQRLDVTGATVRRWCERENFGVRLMGRWRIPETKIAELENKLSGSGAEVSSCLASQT
jgi:predicted site-specific integrase-resolvase